MSPPGAGPASTGPADPGQAAAGPASADPGRPAASASREPAPAPGEPPLRVTTLELFFDLVFAFTLTQLGSPLIVHPRGLFELRPAHMSERHSALVLVALGESVAAIGVGAGRLAGHSGAENARLVAAAVLGLALAATLWWIVFGAGDEEAAERVLTAATSERRTALALAAFF